MEAKEGHSGIDELEEHGNSHETTVIRISSKNYEWLRQVAFDKRSTIRKVADEILENELRDKQ